MKPFVWPKTVMIGVEGGYAGDQLFVSDCTLEDDDFRLYVSPAALVAWLREAAKKDPCLHIVEEYAVRIERGEFRR